MSTPLSDFLEEYAASHAARLHMPGHKGSLSPYDITEIAGADSLYEAQGVIARSEQEMAACYGALETAYSAGGSTLCIQAMLAMAAPAGSQVICSRNLHVAAANAMALLDLRPEFLYGEESGRTSSDRRLPPRLTGEQVKEALEKWPEAKAVYITCPDYFGGMSDIRSIASHCREKGVPLLVDNAHGAHLRFLKKDRHPISLGASLCCDSFHKTLPALTGAAALHVGDRRFVGRAKGAMRLFGSTSPSYLILRSIDQLLPLLGDRERLCRSLELLERRCRETEEAFSHYGALPLLPDTGRDCTRMVLDAQGGGLSGFDLADALRRAGIQPEYEDRCFVVLLPSADTPPEDFQRLMEFARRELPGLPKAPEEREENLLSLCRPKRAMTLRQATLSPSRSLPPSQAVGRVAARSASPCPPGVPVVMAGEYIDQASAELLLRRRFPAVEVVEEEAEKGREK